MVISQLTNQYIYSSNLSAELLEKSGEFVNSDTFAEFFNPGIFPRFRVITENTDNELELQAPILYVVL